MPSIDSSIRWRLIANDGSRCSLVLAVPVDEAVVPVSFFGLHLLVDELRGAKKKVGGNCIWSVNVSFEQWQMNEHGERGLT